MKMIIIKGIIKLIISVILFLCVCSIACAEDGNGVSMRGEEDRTSNCIPAHLLESEHRDGSAEEHVVAKPCDKPEKPAAKPKKDCRPAKEETECKKVDKKASLPCKPERKPEVTPEDACKPEKKEDKHSKSDTDVVSPCKPEKPDEVKPEESCGSAEKKDENNENVVVVSPEESGTGVSEGVVSHGRSENYNQVKIIPVANLSGGINLTIEKPARYVTGNIVELMAGTNLTRQQEAARGLGFKWKVDSKSFHVEYTGRNRTVYLPDGDYSVNLTAIDNWKKETSVGKIVTVTRASSGYAPASGRIEKRSRESVGCDCCRENCFLLCYRYKEKLEFVGVSWIPREGIMGYERSSRPKQCSERGALSRIPGEGYQNKNNSNVTFLYSG